MSRRYVVEIVDEAWWAIDAHARYVAVTLSSPMNAAKWLRRLLDVVDGLAEMPSRFAIDERESAHAGRPIHRLNFERTCVLLDSVDDPAGIVRVLSFHHGGYA